MFPDPGTRATHDRLAQLLSGAEGSEILAALSSREAQQRLPVSGPPATVGPWTIQGAALIRHEPPDCDPFDWSADGDVPAAGAGTQRVVLIGESAARGWPYDPAFNCAQVLERHLNEGGAAAHHVVDLAKIRASAANLVEIVSVLPALAPDVVVAFVGNNVAVPPEEVELRSAVMDDPDVVTRLAESLRQNGYDGLRTALATVARQRCERLLDRLAELSATGCTVVLVVPEFNLAAWVPEPGVETPLLPGDALTSWYELADVAENAAAEGDWHQVLSAAQGMTEIDHGASPVSTYLMGTAALQLGDGKGAREALEMSRDVVSGLLVSSTPRITRDLQDLMVAVADERGWPCVDLRDVLADPALAGLPGPQWFHDYCHLSDIGIERAMAAVSDAVRGHAPGTTQPGPGVPASAQAYAQAHAGIHLAYTNQPLRVVTSRLRSAVAGDPDLAAPLEAIRDLLSGPTPRWTNPAARRLLDLPAAGSFLMSLVQTDGLPPGLWTLREALSEVVGSEFTTDEDDADLLIGPHCGGQSLPNFVPSRCHLQATARRSVLHFGLSTPRPVSLELTYRTRWAQPGSGTVVSVGGRTVAVLAASATWQDQTVELPASDVRSGVNQVTFTWPIPFEDVARRHVDDAAALARRQFPFVLPVFGELFTARLHHR